MWKRESLFSSHILVYLTVGLLQLGYNSAWLMLPVLWSLTLLYDWPSFHFDLSLSSWKAFSKSFYRLGLLTALAMLPSIILIIGTIPVGGASVIQFLWKIGAPSHVNILAVLKAYLSITLDGLVALGPFFIGLFLLVSAMAARERSLELAFALLLFSLQILLCGIFMMPVSGRGYVTFGVAALLVCSGAYCLGLLWQTKNRLLRALALAFPLGSIVYTNLPLLGYRLPSIGFFEGYFRFFTYGQWQAYVIKIFT
jgi:hypothetical protein